MDTVLFAAFAAGYAALLLWAVALARRGGWRDARNVLLPVLIALCYDNAVLAGGRLIGEGALLEALNTARYWLHALLTPLLVIFAWSAAARAGSPVLQRRGAGWLAVALYAALVVVELLTEVRGLTLQPSREYGVLSYSSAEPATGPPLMILGVLGALVAAAVVVWRKQRWPWFLVGVALMAVGGAVPLPVASAAATNAFEFVLLTSLLATRAHQDALVRSGDRGAPAGGSAGGRG